MSILSIATEILYLIAENLELPDLNSLLQANQRLAFLLTPYFRKLALKGDNATAALYSAAAINTDKELIRFLLEKGDNISVLKDSPSQPSLTIHTSPGEVSDEVMRFVLEQKTGLLLKDGKVALHWAAKKGRTTLVNALLNEGASINFQDSDGKSALHLASSLADGSVVELLLRRGAHVDSKDLGGMTPLHVAASKGHEVAVRLLLDYKADINAQDGWKRPPPHPVTPRGPWR